MDKEKEEPMDTSAGSEEKQEPGKEKINGNVVSKPSDSEKVDESSELGVKEDEKDAEKMEKSEKEQSEKENEDKIHCYCGKPRNSKGVEFQCGLCLKFYHAECVSIYLGKCVPFMTNYQFFCKRCNPNSLEVFNKKQASFSQMCHTALANLIIQHDDRNYFSRDNEIIPYIADNWEALTTMPRRTKQTWHNTIGRTMLKDNDIFACKEEDPNDPFFSLVSLDLGKIGPNYEAFLKAASNVLKSGDYRLGVGGTVDTKTRVNKRKAPDSHGVAYSKQKRGEVPTSAKMAPHTYPAEHPFNKDGYRYVLAEPDMHAPNRQAFDESIEWAGKPIPGYLYRTWLGSKVLFALHDRAPQLKVTEDRLTVTGEKGYSMIRATQGVNHGTWYYEVTIAEMPPESATRIGWSQALGNLQAPCGYDKFSYSWRSKKGTVFHQSRGKHYCDSGYVEGDVLGFLIHLPLPSNPGKMIPPTSKDKPLVKFKSHLYFEEKDYVSEAVKNLKVSKGSKVMFFKNGKCQGVAFTDMFEGYYYPAVSLYKNATVTANFGPKFKFPPKVSEKWKAMSDSSYEAVIQHALGDILYIVENEGQLPEFI